MPLFFAADDWRFPILIRVAEFAKVLGADRSPKLNDSPDWLPYVLGKQSEEYRWGVDEAFFKHKLDHERCLIWWTALMKRRICGCGSGLHGFLSERRRLSESAISW